MQPLGLNGSRKLHDIMIDLHVPQAWRRRMPVLVAGDTVLWLIGCRRSDWGKLTAATRRVLTVACVRDADETIDARSLDRNGQN